MVQLELVPAKSTAATYDLYKRYQISVHNDPPSKVSERGFRRFLCDSPLLVRCARLCRIHIQSFPTRTSEEAVGLHMIVPG